MTSPSKTLTALCLTTVLATALASPALANDGPTLIIENFIGTVNVTTDANANKISATGDASLLAADGLTLMIDGDASLKKVFCRVNDGDIRIATTGKYMGKNNYKPLSEYPVVDVVIPEGTHLKTRKVALFGTVGDLGSADLSVGSCGTAVFGDVAGPVKLNIGGSSTVTLGSVGSIDGGIGGSSDLKIRSTQSAKLSLGGSSDIEIEAITGRLNLNQGGSSDAVIGDLSGDAQITMGGSSDLVVGKITSNSARLTTGGSSDLTVKSGTISELTSVSGGSSDIILDVTVGSGTAVAGGSSDVVIAAVTGTLKQTEGGGADITVR